MAFEQLNRRTKKPIRYRGYDRNKLWKPIHDEIRSYFSGKRLFDVKCFRKDVFDVLTLDTPRSNFNVIIIQYLLSHLYNTDQIDEIESLYEALISNVIAHKRDDSPLLIVINDIDSRNKGRDHFWPFLQKVKEAGYNGNVGAKCFKPECYLEESTQHDYDINKFSIPDNIKDDYKCAIECTSAQLIIEVR